MIGVKKYLQGGINTDDNISVLPGEDYLNLVNGRWGISEYGTNGRVENIPGTTAITNNKYPPYGTNLTIGSCVDVENNFLVWFVYNTFDDHGIYAYSFDDQQIYAVLYDSQIVGGLNFSKNSRINRNCRIDQGLLYWTDDLNEPKKINIFSGIKLNQPSYPTDAVPYQTLEDEYEITVIRRPPNYATIIAKDTNGSFHNNFIDTNSFQAAHQYTYYDGENSVLSVWSTASKYNSPNESFNFIRCSLDTEEVIPQTVRIVSLWVKYQNDNIWYRVKTWDKEISNQNIQIQNHNSGTAQLTYDFYGNITGASLDNISALKPFDSVPLLSKTLEIGKDRLFLGNNLAGYDTPQTTSLTLTQNEAEPGSNITTDLLWLELGATDEPMLGNFYLGAYMVFLDTVSPAGYYYILGTKHESTVSQPPPASPIPSTGDYNTDLAFMGYYLTDVANYWSFRSPTGGYNEQNYQDQPTDYTVTGLSDSVTTSFKDGSDYIGGMVFFDRGMRKCGVVTNSDLISSMPRRTYDFDTTIGSLTWTVSNTNAVNEIPDWAYFYAPLLTLNQTTRFYIQSFAASGQVKYVTRDTDGAYVFTGTTFTADTVGVAVDTTPLLQSKLGYTFEQNNNDVGVLIESDDTANILPVIDQSGKWIIFKPEDIGDVTTMTLVYEIFTPYLRSSDEAYYERGQIYAVTNPGESDRQYSTLTGTFFGDTFFMQRVYNGTFYKVEAMNPNDAYFQIWDTDAGRPDFVTLLGQTRNQHEIRYSNIYAPGTQLNGLSTFDPLDFKTVPLGTGSVQKLQLASKTQEQGIIMLSIGSDQTASCYLSEVQVVGASSNAFLAQDTSVIGTINVLKGQFGTTAPETVIEYLGLVFWYDLNNGCIVQYSSNGLFPVSSFKMNNFFQRYAQGYLQASPGNLDNINGFHHIPTAIDPFTKTLNVTTPGLIYPNYATILPSYNTVPSYATNIINYFNPYTQLAQTLMFDFTANKWKETFEFYGEWYDNYENYLFAWKNGTIYTHNTNTTNWNTFYGQQLPVRICVAINDPVSGMKNVSTIRLEASAIPDWTVAYSPTPNIQISDLTADDYINDEGVLDASVLRDRLSPNSTGTFDEKLYKGDQLLSSIPYIQLEFQQYDELFYMNFVNVLFELSRGQNNIIQK